MIQHLTMYTTEYNVESLVNYLSHDDCVLFLRIMIFAKNRFNGSRYCYYDKVKPISQQIFCEQHIISKTFTTNQF